MMGNYHVRFGKGVFVAWFFSTYNTLVLSYMIPESDLEVGQLRLLDVDNRVNVPVDTHVRLVVQSTDVIHDFAVPSLGIKIDAVPGRLNQTSLLAEREGNFYGQIFSRAIIINFIIFTEKIRALA